MRNVTGLIILFCFISCSKNQGNYYLKITFDCTPTAYFDSLSNVLLSNTYRDLGGAEESNSGGFILFGASRVYKKNIKISADKAFYLPQIEKSTYAYLYVEGYVGGALYDGIIRNLDFSKVKSDTAEVVVCMHPNMILLSK